LRQLFDSQAIKRWVTVTSDDDICAIPDQAID
jgi:hypothetical protein